MDQSYDQATGLQQVHGSPVLVDASGVRVADIQDYALIGNNRTTASVSIYGSVESFCLPYFDSPSIFARIVDADKGGHFSITPTSAFRPKQYYLPNSNVLATKFLNDDRVGQVTDLLVPKEANRSRHQDEAPLPWLIRKVEAVNGKCKFRMECAPAFNYCRDKHQTELVEDLSREDYCKEQQKVLFQTPDMKIDLRYVEASERDDVPPPKIDIKIEKLPKRDLLGLSAVSEFELEEGQVVYFILRQVPDETFMNEQQRETVQGTVKRAAELGVAPAKLRKAAHLLGPDGEPILTERLVRELMEDTIDYWRTWIDGCVYDGRWRESVRRSGLTLKMLIFEETGAIVAAPTFSLPEYIGGGRNWDYRFTWIRDSSFTIYALIRLGFKREATRFVNFILDRLKDRNNDGSLQILYTIHGGKDAPEEELDHLAGHKGSRPVRIGNGAVDHIQLDIYGELMDCVYLAQKFSNPLSWDSWKAIRQVVDYTCEQVDKKDLSIWEPRGKWANYTYSKVMMWVALDRGIRLADKRCLPCPNKEEWLRKRDKLYETIQQNSFNEKGYYYGQSYEHNDILDSAVLIMPLVFFTTGADPRFMGTLDQILKPLDQGGLTANASIWRYDTGKTDDGVGGKEGAFSLCTLWGVEALTRAGRYEKKYLNIAQTMFIEFLGYGNHVGLFSEEISPGGEGLGNTPQAFSHVTLISAAYNLNRELGPSNRGRIGINI